MTTLYDATLELARVLMDVQEGTATGGGATTVVDTGMVNRPEGFFLDGTVWLKTSNLGVDTYSTRLITAQSGQTLTFATVTPAVESGDLYAAASKEFPRWLLYQAVNRALSAMGKNFETITEVTAVADQQEYDSDDNAIFDNDIYRVEVATATAAPYDWQLHQNWRQEWMTKRVLIFDAAYIPGAYTMRITTLGAHAVLDSDADVVSPQVALERLVWDAAVIAYRWRYKIVKNDEPMVGIMLNEALNNAARMRAMYPVTHDIIKMARW